MSTKFDQARQAGYSDQEILDFVAKKDPSISEKSKKAISSGYSPKEVLDYLQKIPEERKPRESAEKGLLRSAYQPIGGALEWTGLGQLGQLMNLIGTGESVAELEELEESLPRLKKLFPHANFPEKIDRDKYLQAVEHAGKYNPFSVHGIEQTIEDLTGAPLRPKERGQELLRLAGGAGKIAPAGIVSKAGSAVAAPALSASLESLGVPASVSDVLALGGSQARLPKAPPKMPAKVPAAPTAPSVSLAQETRPLSGRVTKETKELGLRPTAPYSNEPVIEDVGSAISPQRFYNTSRGGQAIKNEILLQDELAYKKVNENYQKSRELNSQIEDIQQDLVKKLETRLKTLKEIPEPSGPQKDIIKTLENIDKRLAVRDFEGNISGYRPISNQTLIDQIQSIRQKIDYDFAHGDTRNLFKPIIADLQTATEHSAMKNPGALESLKTARNSYRQWAEEFDNDYVRPLRNKQNKDFSKIYKSSQDVDELKNLSNVLSKSEKGKKIEQALMRDAVEKKLKPYVEDFSKFNQREFESALRELEEVITPSQAEGIRSRVAKHSKRLRRKAEELKLREKFSLNTVKDLISVALKLFIGNRSKAAGEILSKLKNPENLRRLQRLAEGLPKKKYSIEEIDKIFKRFSSNLDPVSSQQKPRSAE